MTTNIELYLDKSVLTDEFAEDKKLNFLKSGIISEEQFINLIEPTDKYMIVGSAVVAKSGMLEFIGNWKDHKEVLLPINKQRRIDRDLFARIDEISNAFPEIKPIVAEIKTSVCTECAKNRARMKIIQILSNEYQKKEDLSPEFKSFIEEILSPYTVSLSDVEWAEPEKILGVGLDTIEGMNSCLDCVLKHLNRAKVLYEEFILGYPDHKKILQTELLKGEKNAEQCFLKYMDIVAQTDMASAELVGQLESKSVKDKIFMIELAQEIRQARLLFQENSDIVPDFDNFRLKIKKFQLSLNK